jgi:hypothetical protein
VIERQGQITTLPGKFSNDKLIKHILCQSRAGVLRLLGNYVRAEVAAVGLKGRTCAGKTD